MSIIMAFAWIVMLAMLAIAAADYKATKTLK